jgi:hypothetical protein
MVAVMVKRRNAITTLKKLTVRIPICLIPRSKKRAPVVQHIAVAIAANSPILSITEIALFSNK